MKKIIGLMFLLSLVFLIPNLTADDYLLTANPDYYNPFASFAELSQARERLNEYLPKKLLTSLGVPNYLEQTKCNSDALAYQAELWNMKKKKFESGVIPLTDVLFEELRFIDILRKSQNLSESVKTQLIKEYSKRLDKIYSLKKAEFEAGILSSKEWTKWQKTVSD